MSSVATQAQRDKLRQMTTVCACLNARRLARQLTQLYDQTLRSAGVRSTQLPLLATIGLRGATTLTHLADAVVMDRTTLTRSLALLERKRWVKSSAGADLRTREVSLTRSGWAVLQQAMPLWDKAQAQVATVVGETGAKRLLANFASTIDQMKRHARASARTEKRRVKPGSFTAA